MTTLAYRDGILATDTLSVMGTFKAPCPQEKVRLLDDGTLVAVCGALVDLDRIANWLNNPESEKPDFEESAAIHFVSTEEIWVYEANGRYRFTGEFGSWGSGSPAADTAMLLGADAPTAVNTAAQIDVFTGGEIRVYAIPRPDGAPA